jgi:branched-chain amino acid aminotransferase
MQFFCYQNGRIVQTSEIQISHKNLAFMRGYGVFELFRTYEKNPFYLEEHLTRLKNGAHKLNLNVPENIKNIIEKLIQLNQADDLVYKIYLTENENGESELLIVAENIPQIPAEDKDNGIHVILTRNLRVLPEIKSTSYLAAIHALKEAKKQNATDAIYVNQKSELLELTRANFFAVIGKIIYTPKNEILHGITRNIVIELSNELNLKLKETTILENDIPYFDEAFCTATTKEIQPIKQIEGIKIPIGEITKKLQKKFELKVQSNRYSTV